MVQKKINIGFVIRDTNWHGGINYFRSLITAIMLKKNKNIKIFLFIPSNSDIKLFKDFKVKIIKTFFLNEKLFNRIINKLSFRMFKKNIFIEKIFNKHQINLLSHSNYTNLKDIKTISWIGDFQYLHFPKFFDKISIMRNKALHNHLIKESDAVILSCNYSHIDFKKNYMSHEKKSNILKFVPTVIEPNNLIKLDKIKKKFNITNNFYFVPNQFWKHKNHMCIFNAIKNLSDKQVYPNIIFTGKLQDHRNPKYIIKMQKILNDNQLKNIKYLGELSYIEVCSLMYYSKAVINPSYFEGWSTSVEESKIYNKICLLSNIPTHLEQNPPKGKFFNPNTPKELSKLILDIENKKYYKKKFDRYEYIKKRKSFADSYIKIVDQLFVG